MSNTRTTSSIIAILFIGGVLAPSVGKSAEQSGLSIPVDKAHLTFDPRTCPEGARGGFAWGLGSVYVKVVERRGAFCVFDYKWEVEGAGNFQVHRVTVPQDGGPVVIDATRGHHG